jgi:peroxiredoxin
MDVRSPRVIPFVVSVAIALAASQGRAQSIRPTFPERPVLTLSPRILADREIASLIKTLDALVEAPGPAATWGERAQAPLVEFVRQVQSASLTDAQVTRIVAYLDAMALRHSDDAGLIRQSRNAVRLLRVGRVAPDIAATDLDGRNLSLAQYRGKVVVLMFSAEWCAICRTQEPYERFMLDQYKNWPFAIVSVETGESRESVKRAKSAAKLAYRSWWDPAMNGHVGPIATAWNVVGFPRTFLLDSKGVIRFVDVRDEDLLKGVRQLLSEID